jgi:serine/threonine-protein kinase
MNTWAVPGYTESLELGSGASGRVVLAVHEGTGIPVAVKYLDEALHTRPGFVHDFRAEARLLGGLDSPYVAGLYEYVESPDGAAIVMELVEGVSLRSLLTSEGPLEPEAALVILKGSLLGLADAHRVGVVHRDYKPDNVLVMPEGASKLVDFGIAASAGTDAGVAGTPSYMAPEQWTGSPASPAGDVYAATATFFECLTGHKPYTGDNLAELALRHVDSPVPVDEVPEPVRPLVLRGLAKSPEERPTDAEAFVAELEAAAGAAYGPDWERRGRGGLAALVSLLGLLLPSARSATPQTATDTARTVLRSGTGGQGPVRAGGWRPTRPGLLVSGGVALLGILLASVPGGTGPAAQEAAEALATTSAQPGVTSGPTAPTASPSPSGSATAGESPSPSASETSASASATPSDSTDPEPTDTATTGATPTEPAPTSASPTGPTGPVAPAVKDITVSGFRQTGVVTGTTTITVTTDGTGPVSLTVSWYTGDTSGQLGKQDGAPQTFERSGATQYTIAVDHAFRGTGCYWGVLATSSPASADGGASQQLLTRRCTIG